MKNDISRYSTSGGRPAMAFENRNDYEELRREGGKWVLDDRADAGAGGKGGVPAVQKAIAIVSLINARGPELSLATIAEETGITRSHCHSILKTLVDFRWLGFDAERKTYRLDTGILRDLSTMVCQVTPMSLIRPVIDDLPVRTGVSCIVSTPQADGSFVVTAKASNPAEVEISYPIGHRFPADAPAQMKARLLAFDGERLAHEIELTRHATGASPEWAAQTAEAMAATRKLGYARSIGEFTEGLTAFALPVLDDRGEVTFILDCMGLNLAMLRKEAEIVRAMRAAIDEIHHLLGVRRQATPPEDVARLRA
ncbi:hypothetical protein A6J80_20990 (plasmid) [Paracoccus yeei]|uniref:IclR family transcriptional regulator n=2 Tax=Paracoccus yeei TaxID=147645 RepID=A0A1V0GY30_9RHOB|nr:hypothetical protein A6J80_20990 [Paracoccus yeei]